MPSQTQQVTPSPPQSLQPEQRPESRPQSNAALLEDAGLAPLATPSPTARQAAPAAPELAGVSARITAGDLNGAAEELRQIASTQRRLLSGGGDRALLQNALAALAVTESLTGAQKSKESGKLADATRQAQNAQGTLARATGIDAALRGALESVVVSFGVRTADSTREAEPPSAAGPALEGYDAALGQALARASAAISGGNPRPGGRCYGRVADAVDAIVGRFLSGEHAYQAAAQLSARKTLFTETSASDLSSLPAGAIVVWGKGTSASGHISIALGNGQESSDFVGKQMTRHYGGAGARTFLPKARLAK